MSQNGATSLAAGGRTVDGVCWGGGEGFGGRKRAGRRTKVALVSVEAWRWRRRARRWRVACSAAASAAAASPHPPPPPLRPQAQAARRPATAHHPAPTGALQAARGFPQETPRAAPQLAATQLMRWAMAAWQPLAQPAGGRECPQRTAAPACCRPLRGRRRRGAACSRRNAAPCGPWAAATAMRPGAPPAATLQHRPPWTTHNVQVAHHCRWPTRIRSHLYLPPKCQPAARSAR